MNIMYAFYLSLSQQFVNDVVSQKSAQGHNLSVFLIKATNINPVQTA